MRLSTGAAPPTRPPHQSAGPAARLRVVVSSIGRFHHFDLAEELQNRGLLTRIYTGYPLFKLRNTSVDPALIRTFPWVQAPYQVLARSGWFQRHLDDIVANLAQRALDQHVARNLPDCDLVVAQCRAGVATGRAARRRGIAHVCDSGSAHILVQDRLLRDEHGKLGLPWPGTDERAIMRDLIEYAESDAITVPSSFAFESFLSQGIPKEKLYLVPLGVNVANYARSEPRASDFRILFVGQLNVRKGLHHLLRAFKLANLPNATLVLVGGATPVTRPLMNRFPVDDVELTGLLPRDGVVREMSRASVLVLPSVEDGFGMVLAQAMACGCPVIASNHTGAPDLFTDGVEGFIVPAGDPAAIADRLRLLHGDAELLATMSDAAVASTRTRGGWRTYGDRAVSAYQMLIDKGVGTDGAV